MLKAVADEAVAAHFGVRRLDRAGQVGQTTHLEATAVAAGQSTPLMEVPATAMGVARSVDLGHWL